ncbi:MAG: peptidylprolyl isomerase [Tannerella sp.]|jgi:peptidyl-prolyl cis-trans isomerase SurA|nr:peptidylprolyl isomerase [Tannerella sp.]
MKKIVWLLVLAAMVTATEAEVKAKAKVKEKKDPVVMTVAGKDVPMSEFLFIAKKDNSVDFADKKSVEKYVELFKNYKLKVADAEALFYNKAPKFEQELNRYKRQLQESYLQDKAMEDSALHVVYERMKVIPSFKHLMFFLPENEYVTKDTVAAYNLAIEAYNRIKNGENVDSVGAHIKNGEGLYENVECISPLQMPKVLEDRVFAMKPGELSPPIRSLYGFHIVLLEKITPNPGKVRIAQILTGFPNQNPTEAEKAETLKKSEEIYQQAIAGADFAELAKQYSTDTVTGKNGGLLNYFGLCEMVKPFEETAFAFTDTGKISRPIETRYGYHILKLIDRKPVIPFEEAASQIYGAMENSEYNFDLFRGFDEKLKAKYHYKCYPEAYDELLALADDYFPADTAFYRRGIEMKKTLVTIDTLVFPQYEFVDYMIRKPLSGKRYSKDYMNELFARFGRDIATEIERRSLEKSNPEYNQLVQEYYDGILLFEMSNKRVWSQPVEEQEQLEAEWLKELNEKYPVKINWKVLKKLKKYL